MKRWIILGIAAIAIVGVVSLASLFLQKPSNDGTWEVGYFPLAQISAQGSTMMISNYRDYQNGNFVYGQRTIDVNDLTRAWFVVEPFGKFPGIAHTYFVFDFAHADPIAVSVEARRLKGQKYSAWKGLFNQYTLIYVWATEPDQTARRVLHEHNLLYMYPLTISTPSAQKLLTHLAQSTHELETKPRFYNTLLNNCTNELAKAANKVKKGAVPFDVAFILPGYSARLLYRLGFIPHDQPLDVVTKQAFISDIVKEIGYRDNFSAQLRSKLRLK